MRGAQTPFPGSILAVGTVGDSLGRAASLWRDAMGLLWAQRVPLPLTPGP